MIKIIVADDHNIVRQGLKQFIALTSDIETIGEAANGKEILAKLASQDCDVLLMDLTMPGLHGVELIKRIVRTKTAARILVISMHNEAQIVSRAIRAGAAGYLTKDSDPETLIAAIRKVAAGGRYLDPVLVDKMVFDHSLDPHKPLHESLSDREFHIFQCLAGGQSINSIAESLFISAKTVSTHKLRLMQKMQMQSNAELIRYAIDHGLAPP